MDALEVIALIFSVLILVKIGLFLVKPKLLFKFAEKLLHHKPLVGVIYGTLALITGYYLYSHLMVTTIAATVAFAALLFGISYLPYYPTLLQMKKLSTPKQFLIPILLWVAVALFTLYHLFR